MFLPFAVDKRISDLKEFDLAFNTFAEWLNSTEARVVILSSSVLSSVDNASSALNACQKCLEELVQKQPDLDSLATMAEALPRSGISSSHSVFQLSSCYSLTTKKLKVMHAHDLTVKIKGICIPQLHINETCRS